MKKIEFILSYWLIGYFAVLSPLHYIWHGSLFGGLCHGIVGLTGAILILKSGRYSE